MSTNELPYLTIAAVKELKAENDALKAQLAALAEAPRRPRAEPREEIVNDRVETSPPRSTKRTKIEGSAGTPIDPSFVSLVPLVVGIHKMAEMLKVTDDIGRQAEGGELPGVALAMSVRGAGTDVPNACGTAGSLGRGRDRAGRVPEVAVGNLNDAGRARARVTRHRHRLRSVCPADHDGDQQRGRARAPLPPTASNWPSTSRSATVIATGTVAAGSGGQTSYRADTLAANSTYYWRARVQDGSNTGSYSAANSFFYCANPGDIFARASHTPATA